MEEKEMMFSQHYLVGKKVQWTELEKVHTPSGRTSWKRVTYDGVVKDVDLSGEKALVKNPEKYWVVVDVAELNIL